MMRVLTSVFVFDDLHDTFNDFDEAVKSQFEHPEAAEEAGASRRNVASLELWINTPRDRTGGGIA